MIADWIYPEASSDDSSPLVNESEESYSQILEDAGFKEIHFRNDSPIFREFVKKLLEKLTTDRDYIEKGFGNEMFSTILNDHQKLIDNISHHRKFAT